MQFFKSKRGYHKSKTVFLTKYFLLRWDCSFWSFIEYEVVFLIDCFDSISLRNIVIRYWRGPSDYNVIVSEGCELGLSCSQPNHPRVLFLAALRVLRSSIFERVVNLVVPAIERLLLCHRYQPLQSVPQMPPYRIPNVWRITKVSAVLSVWMQIPQLGCKVVEGQEGNLMIVVVTTAAMA